MKNFFRKLYAFSTSWTGTIIIVLFVIFFGMQSFVIPSGSMKRTLLVGDFLFAKKFSYGISIPEIPIIGVKILPDFNGNGHLIEGDKPKREDIVIFYYPKNKKQHFVKRCVAVGGDEILYYDKHLLIHFHEGDEYIKKHYPANKIVKAMGKLWVDNPYKDKYPGIQYQPEYNGNSFMLMQLNINKIDMKPVYVEDLDAPVGGFGVTPMNAFYKKVSPDHFYMIGDNRDNSDDSRFWGELPYSAIIGKPWFTYFSIEYRSYECVSEGKCVNGGRDWQTLKKVCGNTPLLSKECEAKWNRYRFTIRWDRMFRNIENMQYEQPR